MSLGIEELVTALNGLQRDALNREKYNQWLQQFQRSPAAWAVTYEVLASDDYPRDLKIFSAQTLRQKIARDLHQVPRDQCIQLKDQVLVLLERNLDLVNVVGVQLCVALAAFAMQVVEWETPLHDLVARFDTPQTGSLLFEFLRVLPEEFDTTRPTLLDPEIRDRRAVELIEKNAPLVLNFMLQRAQHVDSQRGLFFEALNPWLREVDVGQIVASPLLDAMFQFLSDDDAREAATECICTIIHETNDVREPVVQQAIAVLLPRVLELPTRFASQYTVDLELHRDITRVLAQAGEDWHVLILLEPTTFYPLVQGIAQCVAVPDADLEVVEYTFGFFDDIRLLLEDSTNSKYDATPLRPVFAELIASFQAFLQYPEAGFGSDREAEDKFRDFRYDIGDVLKACCVVTGADIALGHCYKQLVELLPDGRNHWQKIEAVLFCVRLMARVVPITNMMLPHIFQLLPQLPDQEQVRHAAVMFIGRYSLWAAKHEEYIPFALDYILTAVPSGSVEVRRGAAHAFLYFCNDCAPQLVKYLPTLMSFYVQILDKQFIDRESLCKISDGLGSVVDRVKIDEIAPFIETMFEATARHGGSDQIQALASFIAMVRTSGEPGEQHPVVEAVLRCNTAMLSLLTSASAGGYRDQVESVAQYYFQMFYNCGRALPLDVLQQILQTFIQVLTDHPLWARLYLMGTAVINSITPDYEDGGSEVCAEALTTVYSFGVKVAQTLFQAIPEIPKGNIDEEDVIKEGYYFLGAMLVAHTEQFARDDTATPCLLVSSIAIGSQVLRKHDNVDVLLSVTYFFRDLGTFCVDPQPGSVVESRIMAALEAHGQVLVHDCIMWFLWRYDPDVVPHAQAALNTLARICPAYFWNWVKSALDELPVGSVSEEEKFQFLRRIFNTMAARRFDAVGRLMAEFADAYSERNLAPR